METAQGGKNYSVGIFTNLITLSFKFLLGDSRSSILTCVNGLSLFVSHFVQYLPPVEGFQALRGGHDSELPIPPFTRSQVSQ